VKTIIKLQILRFYKHSYFFSKLACLSIKIWLGSTFLRVESWLNTGGCQLTLLNAISIISTEPIGGGTGVVDSVVQEDGDGD